MAKETFMTEIETYTEDIVDENQKAWRRKLPTR